MAKSLKTSDVQSVLPSSPGTHTDNGRRTLLPQDTSAPRHFGTTKLVPKFKPNHRWSCVSSEVSWVEVSNRLFLDHGTRVEVSDRTTFLVSKCLETGAKVSQSVLMPKCIVAEVSGNLHGIIQKIILAQFFETRCIYRRKARQGKETTKKSTTVELHSRSH